MAGTPKLMAGTPEWRLGSDDFPFQIGWLLGEPAVKIFRGVLYLQNCTVAIINNNLLDLC